MTEAELTRRAVRIVEQETQEVLPQGRIVHCEEEREWSEILLRTTAEHRLHVLAPGDDVVFFYDANGRFVGWRDDGRVGTPDARSIDPKTLRDIVVNELELPRETWLATGQPRKLPPVGWTHEATLYTRLTPTAEHRVTAWVDPARFRVIQCWYGPLSDGAGKGASA